MFGCAVRKSPPLALIPLVLAATLAVPTASAAPHRPGARLPIQTGTRTHVVTLATGVVSWRQTIHVHDKSGWHKVHAFLLRTRLGAGGPRIDAGSPGSVVGRPRTNVQAQADATNALGGINADFFSWQTDAAVPHGALVISGHVLKTPSNPAWNANFYVRPDGTAAIGPLPYTGLVTRKPRGPGDPVVTRGIASLNSLHDAVAGRITLVTHGLMTSPIARKCTVAQGATVSGVRTIVNISKGHTKLRRPDRTHWDLVACGGGGGRWLNTNVQAGDRVRTAVTFTNGAPIVAVSGARVLRQGGLPFQDPTGFVLGAGPNPETFACASKTGTSVLFGVLDGRSSVSYGVTYAQLGHYLSALKCYSGMVFDGGGSSTLVARLPGTHTAAPQNVPSDGRLREIADGLYVYAS